MESIEDQELVHEANHFAQYDDFVSAAEKEQNSGRIDELNEVFRKSLQVQRECQSLAVLVNDYLFKPEQQGWISLTAHLNLMQIHMHKWIADQEFINRLRTSINVVVNAHRNILRDMLDLSVYLDFDEIMEQIAFLTDFFKLHSTDEPKLISPYKELKTFHPQP